MFSGAIDADEIMTVFSKMGVHIDRTEANQLLSRYCQCLHHGCVILLVVGLPFTTRRYLSECVV